MNLTNIKAILNTQVKCSKKETESIIKMLDFIRHKGKRAKNDIVAVIEKDAAK